VSGANRPDEPSVVDEPPNRLGRDASSYRRCIPRPKRLLPFMQTALAMTLGWALVPATLGADAAPATSSAVVPPTLTTAAQVRRLTPGEAKRGYPVRLRGVVTCFDAAWSLWCVQQGVNKGSVNSNVVLAGGA
jgi:hypothetical protein